MEDDNYKYLYKPDETFRVAFPVEVSNGAVSFEQRRKGHLFWADFLWPTYEQAMVWRTSCQNMDRELRMMVVDEALYNRIKVTHMFSAWSLAEVDKETYTLNRTSCGCEFCRAQREKGIKGITSALNEDSVKVVFGVKLPIVNRMIASMNMILGI